MHQLMSSLAPIATAKADVRLGSQRDREAVARRFHRGPSTFPTETCQTYARASTWCTPPRGCSGSGWSAAGLRAEVRMSLRSCVRAFCNSRILASALSRLNPTHVEVVDCFLHAAQSRRRLAILAQAELLPRRIEKFCRLTARPRAKYPFAPRSCP